MSLRRIPGKPLGWRESTWKGRRELETCVVSTERGWDEPRVGGGVGGEAVAERRAGSGTRPDTQPGFCLKFSPGSDLRSGPQPRSFHPFPRPPCQCSDPAEVGSVSSTGCVLESWTYRPKKSRSWPGVHHWPGFPSWSSILMSLPPNCFMGFQP